MLLTNRSYGCIGFAAFASTSTCFNTATLRARCIRCANRVRRTRRLAEIATSRTVWRRCSPRRMDSSESVDFVSGLEIQPQHVAIIRSRSIGQIQRSEGDSHLFFRNHMRFTAFSKRRVHFFCDHRDTQATGIRKQMNRLKKVFENRGLLAIHEKLTRIPKHELQLVGWSKATELVKVARKDGEGFDCATGCTRPRNCRRKGSSMRSNGTSPEKRPNHGRSCTSRFIGVSLQWSRRRSKRRA